MLPRLPCLRHTALGAALALAAHCGEPTRVDPETQLTELRLHRAQWAARGITAYQYEYQVTGFFIGYAGQRIRLVVRDGVVESATLVADGKPLPGPLTEWPTIDRLFDRAMEAAAAGVLRGVRFDPQLDYPSEIDLDGPPDASGSVLATSLRPIP
jgi:Family of unknown function (DUF6174)